MQTNNQAHTSFQAPSSNAKLIVLIVASLSNLMTTFMMSGVNVALPSINREFKADAIVLGWVITSFVLSVAVFSVPFGRVADIVGIKKIYILGQGLFFVISLLTVLSTSVYLLIICRFIQGISSAMISSTSVAMLTAVYPAKERGRALGISIACVYAGLSIGPFLGGLLIERFDWRSIFLYTAPISLILFLLLVFRIKGEWAESKGEKFDYPGSFIYGLALVALMYGFTLLPGIDGVGITLVGILGLLGFVYWEIQSSSPLLDISLFRNNKAFVYSNLAALLNYCSTSAITFFLSLYLQYIKDFSPKQAGLVLLAQPLVQTVIAPLSGRLSDKMEPRIVASIGMGITAFGLLYFGFLSADTYLWQIILALAVFGAGFGLFTSPNTNAIMSSVSPRYYATASSLTGTMRTIGQTLSMGIAMIIIALTVGRVIITQEYYPAFVTSARTSFLVFAGLSFIGIFASLARGNRQDSSSTDSSGWH